MIPDAHIRDIVPDNSFLPPLEWTSIPAEDVEDINQSTMRPLNNGRDSPGVKTYLERLKELSVPNEPAFRTIRRQPAPPGEQNARLGNAYELFKYLELLAGFWIDTSQPAPTVTNPDAMDIDSAPDVPSFTDGTVRIAAGSQTPPDFRNSLLVALTKLVAYDFGCNVSLPRIEPRLYISAPSSNGTSATSSFPTNISFIYRTPTVRASARSGIVEGPIAALSARPTTGFNSPHESVFDLCREIASVLVTAQHRSRETKTEKKLLEDLWWCHKPRWGGGPGGPIGREADKVDETGANEGEGGAVSGGAESCTNPSPAKKSRKKSSLYDNYRMVRPPSSTWDRRTKYMAIGRPAGAGYDDVFLLSSLNHHVSIIRVRVPISLLDELEGAKMTAEEGEREKCIMWRSKWFDMFLAADRVEAMTYIWGMMAYMMRKVDGDGRAGTEAGKDAE